ncbi:MAG: hypothetical protein HW398_1000 [Acidobacteria bacterium]|nr:hypothetical protein [Acidobacteriota bacterium]
MNRWAILQRPGGTNSIALRVSKRLPQPTSGKREIPEPASTYASARATAFFIAAATAANTSSGDIWRSSWLNGSHTTGPS